MIDQREKAYFLLSGFSLEWQETKINRAKDKISKHRRRRLRRTNRRKRRDCGREEVWTLMVRIKGTKTKRGHNNSGEHSVTFSKTKHMWNYEVGEVRTCK